MGLAVWSAQVATADEGQDPTLTARRIDELLATELWADAGLSPMSAVDDFTFLRRVSFDLTGRPPSPGEVTRFVMDSNRDKRTAIVDRMINDPDYGVNWAGYWRDVIIYRRTEPRAVLASGALADYLARQFNQNVGWDQIARSFITAEGEVRQHGETAVIMAQGGRPEETVAELSRIFLGIQIQCAQCHDHPYDRWRREQFHELAAFFPRVSLRPVIGGGNRGFAVIGTDFVPRRKPKNDRYLGRSEHFMPDLEDPVADGTRMTPKFFLTDQELSLGTTDKNRRQALADWFTADDNEWFAKALVNRIWYELIGAGFYEPIDDLGPDREVIAPRTLDFLSRQFVASGYDLKFLFRAVMRTDVYQRQSRSRGDTGHSRFLSTHPQRLRSAQLFASLQSALAVPSDRGPRNVRNGYGRQPRAPQQLFATVFGYDPSDPRQEVSGSVQQSLLMMNSALLTNLMGANRAVGLGRLLREYPGDVDLVNELYLRTLSRLPDKREQRVALTHLRRVGNRADGFEDLLWALINSAEFIHRV